jgi:predicted RNA-binding protein associated with RNAse of E/G family
VPEELPAIVEVKRTLAGVEKRFECRLLSRTDTHVAVLWIAPAAMHVHGVDLPAGTISIGHFWTDRNYNVYHWVSSDSSTIGFYFNISDRTVIAPGLLSWRDLTLDVLATPDGRLEVLDEDELPDVLEDDARAHIQAGKGAILSAPAAVMAEVEAASRALVPLLPQVLR